MKFLTDIQNRIDKLETLSIEHTMKIKEIEDKLKEVDFDLLENLLDDYKAERNTIFDEVLKAAVLNTTLTNKNPNTGLNFAYSTNIIKGGKVIARLSMFCETTFKIHHVLWYKNKKYTGKDVEDIHLAILKIAKYVEKLED